MGSCFSAHIGNFFEEHRFHVSVNPFGTLFNPASIANLLRFSMSGKELEQAYIYYFNDRWISFAHHGSFSHPDPVLFKEKIKSQFEKTADFLKKTKYLFITFGTANCYRFKERNLLVANCHKIPQQQFDKILLSVDDIVQDYKLLINELKAVVPQLKIIFTVSPVRHLSDGFHENQISKSILHLAINSLLGEDIFYFPSYEIIMDDLRDYRFYAKDLCHIGEAGIAYIQEMVIQTFLSAETETKRKEIEKENRFLKHKMLHN